MSEKWINHFPKMWLAFLSFAFGLFAWQHIGRINGWNLKPSYFLNLLAFYSEQLWTQVGRALAFIGSYYHYLYFYAQELVISLYELVNPLLHFIASPCYVIYGFLTTMVTFAKPHLVLFGFFLLVASGLGSLFWFFQDYFTRPVLENLLERPEVYALILVSLVFGFACAMFANGDNIVQWMNEAAKKLCPSTTNVKKKKARRPADELYNEALF